MKKFILSLAVLFGCATISHAQFFKKLGKALDKMGQVVDNSGSNNGNSSKDRQIGNTVKIGDMTLAAYGDNPGVGFNYKACYRKDNLVLFYFQLPNQANRDIENIWIRNYEPNETAAYGSDGTKYNISIISMDGSESSEGISKNLSAGATINGVLAIDVPTSATKLSSIVLRCSGQYPLDAITHNYRFVINNIPILPWPEPTVETYTKPAEGWMLTAEGVGPCKIGAMVSSLPSKVDGLYDKIDGDQETETKNLYLGEKEIMTLEVSSGTIVGLSLADKTIGVKVGAKVFRIGGDADLLKKQPGVKGASYNDDAEYNKIRFDGHEGEIVRIAIGKI